MNTFLKNESLTDEKGYENTGIKFQEGSGQISLEKKLAHEMDKRLADILLNIGITANLQGYYYLREAIKLAISSPKFIASVTGLLYPEVASKFQTTACRVERAMRHAIEVSFNKGKLICLNNLLKLEIFTTLDKPSTAEFVALIADKLALELYC